MTTREITCPCPDCRKPVRLVWYDEQGRHQETYVQLLRLPLAANCYRVTCPHCGGEFTHTVS